MPPVDKDPFKMPRDGYSGEPRAPGAEWTRKVPDLPFWYEPLTGKTEMTHVLGTTQGQYDILYGIVWGTRTAFETGLLVVAVTVIIGVILGSIAAYYGGWVDNVIMRITDIS